MEENKKIRTAVIEAVRNLNDEQLNTVVEEGSWSIVQVLEHLYLMECHIVKLIEETLKCEAFESPGDFPVHLVSDRSKKVKAPKKLVPSNTFQSFTDIEKKLSSSRAALENIEENLCEDDLNNKTSLHRLFGMLSLKQWISLVGYHEQRHLKQIEEIKESLSN